jgi:hypothetical protein
MSADRAKDKDRYGVLRTPGSGIGRPEETREVITSTQTSGGLGAGDPQGGPRRTPEREAFDRARQATRAEDPEAGETAGHHAGDPLRAEDAVLSTPPHGDTLRETDE